MKRYLTLCYLFFPFLAFAQLDTTVYHIAEEMPIVCACSYITDKAEQRQCSDKKIFETIYKHFKTPRGKHEDFKVICGRFVVAYIVEIDGSISNIRIVRSCEVEVFDNAIIKAIEAFPQFIPAKQNGKPIPVEIIFPITLHYEYSD